MTNELLLVLIIIMMFCVCKDKKVKVAASAAKTTAEEMCPYPGPQRFTSPDPYNPINIGLLGQEACCGRRDPYEVDRAAGDEYGYESFSAGGCCGSCSKCLPNYTGCMPNNQLAGGQLPCNSIGNFWIDYSRMIGDDMAWALLDANGWPITYDQAVQAIPIGSVLCWNGQPMAKIVSIKSHPNMPYSSFIVLDQSFKINLAGQMVTIRPSNVY